MSFMWMYGLARDIERLAGVEIYKKYGQEIMECLKRDCSENWRVVRYPDDQEILDTIKDIVNFYEANKRKE
jgi:hypothetical protein